MTISSTTRVAGPFTGNGTASAFPFAFKVFAASDLKVVRLNTTTVVETVLVLNSDYTVTLNGNQNTNPGGTVTLVAGPLATGQNLVITTALPNTQPTDLTNQGGFYPEVINDALDRATMQIQQIQEGLDRSVKVPVTQPVSMDQLLADIVTVAADITNVDTVAGSIANVNAVGTNIADVTTVAADLNEPVSEIETVAASITNVDIVGTNIANVNAVGTSIADVNTVAADIADVSTVAADIADVSIVAADIADVSTAATNIAAIIAAPAEAAAAAASALSASNSATAASASAAASQTAASASLAGAYVFDTTVNGLAATTSGQYFLIYTTPSLYDLYLNNAGVAVLQGTLNIADGDSYQVTNLVAQNLSVALSDALGQVALGVEPDGTVGVKDLEATDISATDISATTLDADTVSIASSDQYDAYGQGLAYALTDSIGHVSLGIRSDGSVEVSELHSDNANLASINGVAVADIVAGSNAAGAPVFGAEINHIIGYGQSLSIGVNTGAPISTAQPYDSIMFNGGVIAYTSGTRTAFSPLVEASVETPTAGTTQSIKQLILDEDGIAYTQQSYQLLGSVCGQSSTTVAQLSKGGLYYGRITTDISAAYSLAQAAGKPYKVPAFTWTQGESDYVSNTSYDAYKLAFITLCADIDADAKATTGQSERVKAITYQTQTHLAYSRTYPTVALAQLDLALENDYVHMACPMYQFAYSDAVHLTATSSKWLGAYYGLAYKRTVIDKQSWKPLHPIESFVQGAVIMVRFHVPVAPLVVDTTQVAAHTDYGFELVDSGGSALSISSVSLIGPDTIKIVAAASVPAGAKLRYAFTGTGGGVSGPTTGPRGNIRDSQGDTIVFDPTGINKRMDNWCVIFERSL